MSLTLSRYCGGPPHWEAPRPEFSGQRTSLGRAPSSDKSHRGLERTHCQVLPSGAARCRGVLWEWRRDLLLSWNRDDTLTLTEVKTWNNPPPQPPMPIRLLCKERYTLGWVYSNAINKQAKKQILKRDDTLQRTKHADIHYLILTTTM